MSVIDIVERLAGIFRLILCQVITCQNRTGVGYTLEKIILKECAWVRQVTFTLNCMITIPIPAVGDLRLLIAKTIDILTQRSPGGIGTRRRIVLDDQVRIQDEALAENMR